MYIIHDGIIIMLGFAAPCPDQGGKTNGRTDGHSLAGDAISGPLHLPELHPIGDRSEMHVHNSADCANCITHNWCISAPSERKTSPYALLRTCYY